MHFSWTKTGRRRDWSLQKQDTSLWKAVGHCSSRSMATSERICLSRLPLTYVVHACRTWQFTQVKFPDVSNHSFPGDICCGSNCSVTSSWRHHTGFLAGLVAFTNDKTHPCCSVLLCQCVAGSFCSCWSPFASLMNAFRSTHTGQKTFTFGIGQPLATRSDGEPWSSNCTHHSRLADYRPCWEALC